jgi:hypothetical protein
MIKRILQNAINSIWTSIAGSIAGISEIISGVQTNDTSKIISGTAIVILGLISSEK